MFYFIVFTDVFTNLNCINTLFINVGKFIAAKLLIAKITMWC